MLVDFDLETGSRLMVSLTRRFPYTIWARLITTRPFAAQVGRDFGARAS
jgi:hypothetical protein